MGHIRPLVGFIMAHDVSICTSFVMESAMHPLSTDHRGVWHRFGSSGAALGPILAHCRPKGPIWANLCSKMATDGSLQGAWGPNVRWSCTGRPTGQFWGPSGDPKTRLWIRVHLGPPGVFACCWRLRVACYLPKSRPHPGTYRGNVGQTAEVAQWSTYCPSPRRVDGSTHPRHQCMTLWPPPLAPS